MSAVPVSPRRPLIWHPGLAAIQAAVPAQQEIYIVGGAVRDAYLHLPLHDLDLATPGDGRPLARLLADRFKGAYYPLDAERGVGRAIVPWQDTRMIIDVAQFRGPDLLTDLRLRDFTVNALAVRLTGDLQAVIDPLGGLRDLEAGRLRQCHPDSIASDPVRGLRAVRASTAFNLLIEPATRQSLKTNASRLCDVSPERIRDEFFQILNGKKPAAALAALHQLGLLEHVIPEAVALIGVEQSAPHQFDVWQHTLKTVEGLDTILQIIVSRRNDNLAANMQYGLIAAALGGVRSHLQDHLNREWPNGRTQRALLVLGALLHDSGKPSTRSVDADGSTHFLRHEQASEKLTVERAAALRLSNDEIAALGTLVRHHMRPHWLNTRPPLTARAVYRFWRDTGPAGVDICLLAMADYLATYGIMLDSQAWVGYLEVIQALLDRYYLHHETAIAPPALITGQHLLDHFHLEPGPQIGDLLERVREAQVTGEITTTKEALEWVQRFLENHP